MEQIGQPLPRKAKRAGARHGKSAKPGLMDWARVLEGSRAELIDGTVTMMSPASFAHGDTVLSIGAQLKPQLRGRRCRVSTEAFLALNDDDGENLFAPDLMVVCNPALIQDGVVTGSPNLVVEVLSPTNRRRDLVYKMDVYQRSQVPEYWVVDVEKKTVMVNTLTNGQYQSAVLEHGVIRCSFVPDLHLDVDLLFEDVTSVQ